MRKPKYKPPYPLVEVIWDDAASNSETWVTTKDIQPPEQVVTVGYLVKERKRYVCVASSVPNEDCHEDQIGNTMTIPNGMIVTMREIKPGTVRWMRKAEHLPDEDEDE
jgi:hypothetical protein